MTIGRQDHNPTETLWRSLNTLSVTRVLIAGILFILLGLNNSKFIWSINPHLYGSVCVMYLVGALMFVGLQLRLKRYFLSQLAAQLTFDVLVISVLFYFAGGINSSLVILYLFPLASCAILMPLTWALFLSSIVALYILVVGSLQIFESGTELAISNSGLYGAAFFAMVYAVNRLANRLLRQEALARERGRNLHIQQEINKLIVADMSDGIIVVDADSRVYTCNPASHAMLGIPMVVGVTRLCDVHSLQPIADAFFSWRNHVPGNLPVWEKSIVFPAKEQSEESFNSSVMIKGVRRDVLTHLKLRFVTVNAEFGTGDERCVIFLQDASDIENQAQQLKLASMGRLTASIAHEVRNPLASISYAAGLLGESLAEQAQPSRLVKIVADNVVRLNRLIEDILGLSRKAQINGEPFLLKAAVQKILQEFQETHGVALGLIEFSAPESLMVRFDPMHLREVVVNLLTNAIRYASGEVGSVQVFIVADLADQLELHVQDDGPGISAEVRAHLFEPFYTTASRGTGLGLYMARELCLNNGALLDYEYRVTKINADDVSAKANGRFVITFVKPR